MKSASATMKRYLLLEVEGYQLITAETSSMMILNTVISTLSSDITDVGGVLEQCT